MNREQFIEFHPLLEELEKRGVSVIGNGNQRKAKCPFHDDKEPDRKSVV